MDPPETRYARSGDVHIAYQVDLRLICEASDAHATAAGLALRGPRFSRAARSARTGASIHGITGGLNHGNARGRRP